MKITDIKCAVIANSPLIRITTDEGTTGWSQIEIPEPYLQPIVLQLKSWLVGQDPVNVERVVKRIRVRGGFKRWGAAVSAIEIAQQDIAGKAADLPVYRLLGGKVRDQVGHIALCTSTKRASATPPGITADAFMECGVRAYGFLRLRGGMALWRDQLLAGMHRNADAASDFLSLRTHRIVELRSKVEI